MGEEAHSVEAASDDMKPRVSVPHICWESSGCASPVLIIFTIPHCCPAASKSRGLPRQSTCHFASLSVQANFFSESHGACCGAMFFEIKKDKKKENLVKQT